MNSHQYQQIIENYITAYNQFDTNGMLKDMDDDILFENSLNDEVNLRIIGKSGLKQQIINASELFSQRTQTIQRITIDGDSATVDVHYTGVLAVDFNDTLKTGSKLELTGKSIFTFKDDKISELRDIS
ncbi:nuclear transport factor 2 family protein [Pedobacter sp. HMF7647]|uniref:Nuclear transport factor 2 family protein n=1 Tax=Hufsiella arboris TaxID=2695275 RepID=A0A7K1YDM7_9SPHI|nr:nuclear transport factor 2 family protein [Hufsiella arboris]MXV52707.1 nuclear transport factor 2 family protein [Hufsiella arboris]